MIIKTRDQDIINAIEDFRIMTSGQIYKLFFADSSERYGRMRLQLLTSMGFIKRARSTINNNNAYYIDKRSCQIHHDLIRSELYVNLKSKYEIMEWTNEATILNIRPDAIAYIKDHGIIFPVFVEVHLNNIFSFDKYAELYKNNDLKAMYGIIPRVIICGDRKLVLPNSIGIKFKVVGLDMKGLESIFK